MTPNGPWPFDFGYAPATRHEPVEGAVPFSLLVAAADVANEGAIADALGVDVSDVTPLILRAPIFWWRVEGPGLVERGEVEERLRKAGIAVRYAASVGVPDRRIVPLATAHAVPCRASDWSLAQAPDLREPEGEGAYFLGSGAGGLAVVREVVGTGAGTRLAVIEDDVADTEKVGLDAVIAVAGTAPARGHFHGALMVAWARGAWGVGVAGVAPGASARLYVVPKGGDDRSLLALAIVRAVLDGADVILCPTFVDGATTPMLNDALTFATELGRGGLGAAIVMPTGRDASSPEGSTVASWTLGMGEPAADPRVFCVGPSGRQGGWFFWRDPSGKNRPFANRSPALRWLAPGDDLPLPFGRPGRTVHAESSGASALAAGVLLLVLGKNPTLHRRELDAVLTRTARVVRDTTPAELETIAAAAEVAPWGTDADGHNARFGYGILDARAACLTLVDPFAAALTAIGAVDLAQRFAAAVHALGPRWSPALGQFAARACIADSGLAHGFRSLVRHLRLVAVEPTRGRAHGVGVMLRQLAQLSEDVARSAAKCADPCAAEAHALAAAVARTTLHGASTQAAIEDEIVALAVELLGPPSGATSPRSSEDPIP